MRYLKEISKRVNNERSSTSLSRKNSRSCCGGKEHEKFFWVPKESFEFAHKFKESLQGQTLNNELIESMLFEVLFTLILLLNYEFEKSSIKFGFPKKTK